MADISPCPTSGSEVKAFVTDKTAGVPLAPVWTDDFNTTTAAAGALQQIFQTNSVQLTRQREQLPGGTGSRQRHAATNNHVANSVAGVLSKRISAVDAAFWIPKILTMDEFHLLTLISDVNRYESRWLKIAQATLSGTEGGSVDLSMSVVGKESRDKDADQDGVVANAAVADPDASLASIGLTEIHKPLLFGELELDIAGDIFCFSEFSLTISNTLSVRLMNSKNAKCISPGMREVGLRLGLPYNSEVIGVWKDAGDSGLASATLNLFRYADPPTNLLEIGFSASLGLLKYPDNAPSLLGDDDVGYTIQAQAFTDGTTPDIVFGAVDLDIAT